MNSHLGPPLINPSISATAQSILARQNRHCTSVVVVLPSRSASVTWMYECAAGVRPSPCGSPPIMTSHVTEPDRALACARELGLIATLSLPLGLGFFFAGFLTVCGVDASAGSVVSGRFFRGGEGETYQLAERHPLRCT